ncbi:hypothetical protein [Saliterribacillus persicus]|uniref:Uncharacterized protein n=1 Tax=Saliterribacillus persicus TaxID=930114 RepID=A0A368XRL0_9BACI|nr:hypothetical protein [Saliterribacillus persicus]RCW70690.1 hypothetical protein DFR57_10687 [Saliterribacillus persicus]
MSWKAVEMQVALPRTNDAGKIQDLLQQQGRLTQDQLAENQQKINEQKRKQVNDLDKKQALKNNKNGNHGAAEENDRKELQQEENEEDLNHPFLGNHVDFNG